MRMPALCRSLGHPSVICVHVPNPWVHVLDGDSILGTSSIAHKNPLCRVLWGMLVGTSKYPKFASLAFGYA
jgi:hypothetical protein